MEPGKGFGLNGQSAVLSDCVCFNYITAILFEQNIFNQLENILNVNFILFLKAFSFFKFVCALVFRLHVGLTEGLDLPLELEPQAVLSCHVGAGRELNLERQSRATSPAP